MFTCCLCNQLSQPGEKAVRVVLETRHKIYLKRLEAHYVKSAGAMKGHKKDDPGGEGTEIVREGLAHKACADPAGFKLDTEKLKKAAALAGSKMLETALRVKAAGA